MRAGAHPCPSAREVKAVIRERRAQGASAAEIRAELASRYGRGALRPRVRRVLALTLALVLVVGAVTVARRCRRSRREAPDVADDGVAGPAPSTEPGADG